ncbi:MAG: M48 family metallopeptidase [Maritimibacter sp.]
MAQELHLDGDPPVAVQLKTSARARRLSLRVSRLDGRVTMTVPRGIREREVKAFAQEKADWIRGHLANRPADEVPLPGTQILFEGRTHAILAASGRRVVLGDGVIHVPESRPELTPVRLEAFMKHVARERLAAASDRHAKTAGRTFGRITLRDTRSRWGSCSTDGNLMYSWRLIMAPPAVLDYVAAHEVAHLVHMDHSDRFWGLVSELYPDHKAQRRWLRREGMTLHRYRFRSAHR